ncbi:hypothetical protein JQ506_22970 [Shinella sp. PSBB067]|uniref:hypothetical protein n=1 Tax=Shinella sp. PSBB067 TaxID=2715959 RepID=UPI00193B6FB1|nr:hypothetical protein [Shinella sp. PSBB067]QRI63624.1 hypothetical protein JQ506_22970 [Shinella sp. PSBB067]
MVINLMGRIEKLEASAASRHDRPRKVVRLVVNEDEEAEAYRQAEEMGLDTSPESDDLLIIRLIALAPKRPQTAHRL